MFINTGLFLAYIISLARNVSGLYGRHSNGVNRVKGY